jgi:hypothetical protein
MNRIKTDIDIDFKNRNDALSVLPHIAASMVNQGKSARHNTGIYFQNIPVDPLTGHASIPYAKAEDMGYFKIDLINNSVYEGVRDTAHLEALLDMEPAWDLLDDPDIVGMLAHIHSHFDVVSAIKPKSVDDLAVVLALIRPGKKHLVGKTRAAIDAEVWVPPNDGSYHFKKSHSFAYSVSILVQLNAIVERALTAPSE